MDTSRHGGLPDKWELPSIVEKAWNMIMSNPSGIQSTFQSCGLFPFYKAWTDSRPDLFLKANPYEKDQEESEFAVSNALVTDYFSTSVETLAALEEHPDFEKAMAVLAKTTDAPLRVVKHIFRDGAKHGTVLHSVLPEIPRTKKIRPTENPSRSFNLIGESHAAAKILNQEDVEVPGSRLNKLREVRIGREKEESEKEKEVEFRHRKNLMLIAKMQQVGVLELGKSNYTVANLKAYFNTLSPSDRGHWMNYRTEQGIRNQTVKKHHYVNFLQPLADGQSSIDTQNS